MFYEGNESEEIMNVEAFMKYLGISRATAYKLLHSGKIKVLRIGRMYRISKKSVNDYVCKESR